MRYLLCNKLTGAVADINSTILENRPIIVGVKDPFTFKVYDGEKHEDFTGDNEDKATRALNILRRDLVFEEKDNWHIIVLRDDLYNVTEPKEKLIAKPFNEDECDYIDKEDIIMNEIIKNDNETDKVYVMREKYFAMKCKQCNCKIIFSLACYKNNNGNISLNSERIPCPKCDNIILKVKHKYNDIKQYEISLDQYIIALDALRRVDEKEEAVR